MVLRTVRRDIEGPEWIKVRQWKKNNAYQLGPIPTPQYSTKLVMRWA